MREFIAFQEDGKWYAVSIHGIFGGHPKPLYPIRLLHGVKAESIKLPALDKLAEIYDTQAFFIQWADGYRPYVYAYKGPVEIGKYPNGRPKLAYEKIEEIWEKDALLITGQKPEDYQWLKLF